MDCRKTIKQQGVLMKKVLFCLLLVLFCLTTPFAHAKKTKLDMNRATCGDIEDENDLLVFVSWADGYLSAKRGDMVIDVKTIETNVEQIMKTCSENDKHKLKDFLKQ
jgi:hypothetical protein